MGGAYIFNSEICLYNGILSYAEPRKRGWFNQRSWCTEMLAMWMNINTSTTKIPLRDKYISVRSGLLMEIAHRVSNVVANKR